MKCILKDLTFQTMENIVTLWRFQNIASFERSDMWASGSANTSGITCLAEQRDMFGKFIWETQTNKRQK